MVLKSSVTRRQWCTPGDDEACASKGLVAFIQSVAFVITPRKQPVRVILLIFIYLCMVKKNIQRETVHMWVLHKEVKRLSLLYIFPLWNKVIFVCLPSSRRSCLEICALQLSLIAKYVLEWIAVWSAVYYQQLTYPVHSLLCALLWKRPLNCLDGFQCCSALAFGAKGTFL